MESCRSAVEPSRLNPRPSTLCSLSRTSTSRVSASLAAGVMETPMPSLCASSISSYKILALQRIAAGENQLRHGVAEPGNLAQKLHALLEGQLVGVRFGHRLGAAMPAGQRTSLRHFPVDIHGRPGVIARRVAGIPKVRCHMPSAYHIFGPFYSKKRRAISGVGTRHASRFPNQR
jgi:hypothetical protein